jgi:hypothetical protein
MAGVSVAFCTPTSTSLPQGATKGRRMTRTTSVSDHDDIVKVAFNLTRRELDQLRGVAARRGEPVTQMLREAIATHVFLDGERETGGEVVIRRDGKYRRVEWDVTDAPL